MNERKLFPEKKLSKKGILEFLDKKGFYIVLILCIAIVGVTAVIISTNGVGSSRSNPDEKIIPEASESGLKADAGEKAAVSKTDQSSVASPAASNEVKAEVGNKSTAPGAESTVALNEAKKEVKPQQPKANTSSKKTAAAKSSTSDKYIMPVFGEITFEYAQDKLVYSKTLEDWRTHSGIDLAADRGTAVKAVADGVVSEIKNDPRYGVVVLIEHQNGIKTVYANLASDEMVTPNQKVKQGDVIGAVGNTAAFESSEQPHLHFEVLKNNKPVDPLTYLPKK